MHKDSFETISAGELERVGGGFDIGALMQGIGSFLGPKGQAITQGISGIWQSIQGMIGAFQGGGQQQQPGGGEQQQAPQQQMQQMGGGMCCGQMGGGQMGGGQMGGGQ
ncbi:MAG TPA: hypothetical protein VMZ53_05600 [Kofleriaceae bacterium]|nr:hypothetical protein [Kofleriaceae bacterium]